MLKSDANAPFAWQTPFFQARCTTAFNRPLSQVTTGATPAIVVGSAALLLIFHFMIEQFFIDKY